MYEEFYGLREKPFSLTPDPQYLFLSESHRVALKSLLYGIQHREGFMVLTGDIGTGKTTLCRALLGRLGQKVKTAVIFNSYLSDEELLKSILQDLGCPCGGGSKKEYFDALNKFLLQQLAQGKNVALIIDEAQNLSVPVLEMIRMLSNLETDKEKMLQIVLMGQLELDNKLRSPKLRQLHQRMAMRLSLLPLTPQETESYILQRLLVAGAQGSITFSNSALKEVYAFSKGTPRLINLLSDRALLGGFVKQTFHIDKHIIKKAEKSLLGHEGGKATPPFFVLLRRSLPWHISLLLISFSLLAGTLLSNQTIKNLIWHKMQSIYLQISANPIQPVPKIEAKMTPTNSAAGFKGGPLP